MRKALLFALFLVAPAVLAQSPLYVDQFGSTNYIPSKTRQSNGYYMPVRLTTAVTNFNAFTVNGMAFSDHLSAGLIIDHYDPNELNGATNCGSSFTYSAP